MHLFFGLADDPPFAIGRDQIVGGERQTAEGALAEAKLVHVVQQLDRASATELLITVADHAGQLSGAQRRVVERHASGQNHVEDHATHGRVDPLPLGALLVHFLAEGAVLRQPQLDAGVRAHLAGGVGRLDFFHRAEGHAVALRLGHAHRQVVATHDDVLRGADDRGAVGGAEDVVRAHHQRVGFDLGLDRQRQVHGHLVAVEVGVEALAHQRMELNGVAFDQHRLKRLDAHAVQRRSAVEEHGVIADHLFEDIPHLVVLALQHLLGRFDRVGVAQLLEPADDERLVQLQRDLLGQSALVQLEPRTHDDHRAGRVVDALAQQVLAEAALLALDHVGERLERAIARTPARGACSGCCRTARRPIAAASASRCG